MTQAPTRWNLQGDYFESCNCDFVCPCVLAPTGPLTASPTKGFCDLLMAFHIDNGTYGNASLNGLSVVAIVHADGVMSKGNWSLGLYVDQRANGQQQQALQAIFGGAAGGPVAALAPLVGKMLGVKQVPITFTKEGKKRSVQIPNIMHMGVQGIPSMYPDGREVFAAIGHPFNPEQLAFAKSEQGNTFNDYGIRLDNSGKNGHYAALRWSNG